MEEVQIQVGSHLSVNPKHVIFVTLGQDLKTALYVLGFPKLLVSEFDFATTVAILKGSTTYEKEKAKTTN